MRTSRIVLAVVMVVVVLGLVGCMSASGTGGEKDSLHSVVPDVMGQTQADATAALTEAGYVVGEVSTGVGSPTGTVVSQKPAGGTSVPRESAVDLVIAQ